ILFIHTDQMHHLAISAYGNTNVSTPNIDQLIEDGISFRQSYSANPVCCPARASWYTGRMSVEHGVISNKLPIDPNLPDLGQWLTQHTDYDCVYSGKWHVTGRDVAKSFRVLYGRHPYGELQDSGSARAASQYIAQHASEDPTRPFFLSVGLLNPHDCCYVCGVNGPLGKYGMASELPDLPDLPENFDVDQLPANLQSRAGHWTREDWQYYVYQCYRMVETADAQIGLIYDTLKSTGQIDNTLVIFSADHGEGSAHHRRILKGFFEEESWAVPLVISLPGTLDSGRADASHLVSGVDLPATICDYAGAPPLPDATVATSLRPLLEGQDETSWREYVVAENASAIAIRDERFKSILYDAGNRSLYDLIDDPFEKQNLADESGYGEIKTKHAGYLAEYASTVAPCTVPDETGILQTVCDERMPRLSKGQWSAEEEVAS
ncbi:MAG: sulfatase-like hydrolase/transferase, partial [Candidatus Latescibacteria bacterium]|nr:sulfatase-like hydrolase/transferase [Candidatus Latescibacterota bacterium]